MNFIDNFVFPALRIDKDCQCAEEIKRLILRRKAMTNIDKLKKVTHTYIYDNGLELLKE